MVERIHYVTKDIEKVIIGEYKLRDRIEEIAHQISVDYEGLQPVMICILRGSCLFFADLMKEIDIPVEMEFMSVSSYGGSTSTGDITIRVDLLNDIKDKDVIIVEDIVDTGITLNRLVKHLKTRNPKSVEICALLDKKERREVEVDCKYIGFECPNEFVVGYGLDYNEKYRNYRSIGVLKPEIYENE